MFSVSDDSCLKCIVNIENSQNRRRDLHLTQQKNVKLGVKIIKCLSLLHWKSKQACFECCNLYMLYMLQNKKEM